MAKGKSTGSEGSRPPRNRSVKSVNRDALKPGSNPEDAKKVGGSGDFGVAESDVVGRTYTSANTKRSDPGAAPAHAGEDGQRTSGVGGNEGAPGSSSGGDLDTDIIGFGTGGGVTQSGSDGQHTPGPDDSDGTSNEFAGGKPAEGRNQKKSTRHGGGDRVHGSVVQREDDNSGQGADAASQTDDTLRDSFAGEVSSGEAGGDDNSPSDRQG